MARPVRACGQANIGHWGYTPRRLPTALVRADDGPFLAVLRLISRCSC